MSKKQRLTPTTRAYMERFLDRVEAKRSQPFCQADEERILAQMQSEDEETRANAVREICSCRMPWEVFFRLRKAAKRLQQDPSPLVRANALHVEEDARLVASFEAQLEQVKEYEEEAEARPEKQGRRRRKGRDRPDYASGE